MHNFAGVLLCDNCHTVARKSDGEVEEITPAEKGLAPDGSLCLQMGTAGAAESYAEGCGRCVTDGRLLKGVD